eukprot:PhM_4_TR18017/c0_g1_i1/m.33289
MVGVDVEQRGWDLGALAAARGTLHEHDAAGALLDGGDDLVHDLVDGEVVIGAEDDPTVVGRHRAGVPLEHLHGARGLGPVLDLCHAFDAEQQLHDVLPVHAHSNCVLEVLLGPIDRRLGGGLVQIDLAHALATHELEDVEVLIHEVHEHVHRVVLLHVEPREGHEAAVVVGGNHVGPCATPREDVHLAVIVRHNVSDDAHEIHVTPHAYQRRRVHLVEQGELGAVQRDVAVDAGLLHTPIDHLRAAELKVELHLLELVLVEAVLAAVEILHDAEGLGAAEAKLEADKVQQQLVRDRLKVPVGPGHGVQLLDKVTVDEQTEAALQIRRCGMRRVEHRSATDVGARLRRAPETLGVKVRASRIHNKINILLFVFCMFWCSIGLCSSVFLFDDV